MNRKYLLVTGQLPEPEDTPQPTIPAAYLNQYQNVSTFAENGVQRLMDLYTHTVMDDYRRQLEARFMYGSTARRD